MADPAPPATSARYGKHWVWFIVLLSAMGILGFAAAIVLMLPLAMATDACHDGTADKVCQLSATGQNVLVWIPWMCLVAGTATALVGAAVAEQRTWTPLIGIPVGILGYVAMIPIGYALAFAV